MTLKNKVKSSVFYVFTKFPLLSKYFEKHEFELFKFYSDIYVLDEQLIILAEKNTFLLADYLQWLATTKQSFSSLNEFIVFLQKKITLESYQHFINNPNIGYASLVDDYFVQPDDVWEKAISVGQQENSSIELINNTPETSLWAVGSTASETSLWAVGSTASETSLWAEGSTASETSLWAEGSTLLETLSWTGIFAVPESKRWLPNSGDDFKGNVDFWSDSKKLFFGLGDTVCTYNDNYFGVVQSLTTTNVIVSVMGQSKKIVDGIIFNVDKGELFRANRKNSFLPTNDRKSFAKTDVARCRFQ